MSTVFQTSDCCLTSKTWSLFQNHNLKTSRKQMQTWQRTLIRDIYSFKLMQFKHFIIQGPRTIRYFESVIGQRASCLDWRDPNHKQKAVFSLPKAVKYGKSSVCRPPETITPTVTFGNLIPDESRQKMIKTLWKIYICWSCNNSYFLTVWMCLWVSKMIAGPKVMNYSVSEQLHWRTVKQSSV